MTTTTVKVLDLGIGQAAGNIPHHLGELIGVLANALGNIPAEYRDTGEVDCEPYYDYGEAYERMVITYQRPETPEETAARVTRERAHLEERIRAHEALISRLKVRAA